ncbi:MAG: AEC family transporter [Rhodospirillales bacterium]|nr:AEC family transporter [Rhodospirillales bacterium]
MAEIAGLVLPLFGLIILGYVTARLTRQPREAMGWLSTFIIYLALPALFFKLLSKTPIEKLASWDFILATTSSTFLIFLLVFGTAHVIRRADIPEATIQGLAGAYGNIGYMGPALAILTFGEQAAIPVALIFCFDNVMHFTLAPTLMALSGAGNKSIPRLVLGIVRSIAFHPFIIATIVGVSAAITHFTPPLPLERLIDYLAQAAAPSALFAMGVTLALNPLKRIPGELSFIVPVKLIVHPLIMYVLLSLVGDFDAIWVYTAVLLASLPTATNVFVLAQQYGFWVERASACILITTLLSVFSLSALLYAITNGLLPVDLFPAL